MGEGESLARGEVLALEEAIAAQFPEALAVIRAERMNAERRPTRIRVRDLEHELRGDVLRLTIRAHRRQLCDHRASRDHGHADSGD